MIKQRASARRYVAEEAIAPPRALICLANAITPLPRRRRRQRCRNASAVAAPLCLATAKRCRCDGLKRYTRTTIALRRLPHCFKRLQPPYRSSRTFMPLMPAAISANVHHAS
jgi:hypothetical protein